MLGGLLAKLFGNGVEKLRADIATEIDANIVALRSDAPLKTDAWEALQREDGSDLARLRERARPAYAALAAYQHALSAYVAIDVNDPRAVEFAQIANSKGEELMHTMRTVRGLLNS